MEADGACGKNTLPVRLGLGATAMLYFAIHATAAIAVTVLAVQGHLPPLAPLAPLLVTKDRATRSAASICNVRAP